MIRAAYVQPGCVLEETAFGYSYFAPPDFSEQYFIPYTLLHNENTQIVVRWAKCKYFKVIMRQICLLNWSQQPMHTRRGQNFFCTCNTDLFPAKIAWALGSLCFFVLFIIISLLIRRHYWPRNKPVLIVPKTKIVQFRKGVSNKLYLVDDENENNDAAPGVLQACSAPYNPDLEISRDDLDFSMILSIIILRLKSV